MKNYTLKSAAKNQETNTVWDAFVEYLETVYFVLSSLWILQVKHQRKETNEKMDQCI